MRASSPNIECGQVGDVLKASDGGGGDVVKHCLAHADPTDKGIILKHVRSVDMAENPSIEVARL